jgi:hypothetical protein
MHAQKQDRSTAGRKTVANIVLNDSARRGLRLYKSTKRMLPSAPPLKCVQQKMRTAGQPVYDEKAAHGKQQKRTRVPANGGQAAKRKRPSAVQLDLGFSFGGSEDDDEDDFELIATPPSKVCLQLALT